ncbi:MAG: TetM/TetW/TetO/TetS family tetracycline resistance ribosomal protection protein [Eubacterium sp.]|nr:TetM/TetW/TetO/TetS family tetracycline resistance ribosomal protection protein [Eubacterium sp.]
MSKRLAIGIMAHVDAGKTTLSEGLLYAAGMIKERGRVDHGDAFLDNYALEKKRGITIFSKQAVMPWGTLIDTPGHVDFSAEAERVFGILDYGVLVISGPDGVQGHTRTLWRLLEEYEIPVFIFVNKMDQPGSEKNEILTKLRAELSSSCVDFSYDEPDKDNETGYGEFLEEIAVLDEKLMESYLENGEINREEIKRLILDRKVFPVFYGAALSGEGVEKLYNAILTYTMPGLYSEEQDEAPLAERVFKISRDSSGARLTHIRIFSGKIRPKQLISTIDTEQEKTEQIRLYSGERYETVNEAGAGVVCALTGLLRTYPGQGIGELADMEPPVLVPVLNYRMIFPKGTDPVTMLPKLREIEEEQPELNIVVEKTAGLVDESAGKSDSPSDEQIHVRVMGEVQTEILKELIFERTGVETDFGKAGILYKETVTRPACGIGHYEPLRHYAEVHLKIEPAELGSGVSVCSEVSADELDINWQRLIMTHILERKHPGVLIGAPLDDVRITVTGGRAHQKHTEGGDFRQATYRAIRHGLMQAECVLLEPYYDYTLSLPVECVGRAMTDIERMNGTSAVEADETGTGITIIKGTAPVANMQEYAKDVMVYSGGRGELSLAFHGYLPCRDSEEVTKNSGYDPEKDEMNPVGSVFCAHGAGYYVQWEEVADKAHVETGWSSAGCSFRAEDGSVYVPDNGAGDINDQSENPYDPAGSVLMDRMDAGLGVDEIDEIIIRAGSANKRTDGRSSRRAREKTVRRATRPVGSARPRRSLKKEGNYLLIDGYNVIHSFSELKKLASDDMDQARGRLLDMMCNYQGYDGSEVIVVFDAYRLEGHPTESFDYHNIHVIYTKTAETADQYIERFSVEKAEKYNVSVVTNDGLEQIIIRGAGAHLMSAGDLEARMRAYRAGDI